jgi:hypothetical protein
MYKKLYTPSLKHKKIHNYFYFFTKIKKFQAPRMALATQNRRENMAYNVPAVYDVLAARISKCVAFAGRTKCAGATALEWSVAE